MTIRFFLHFVLGTLLLTTGCRKNQDDPTNDLFSTYDRRALLTRIRDRGIGPAHERLATQAAILDGHTAVLAATPTASALDSVQAAWGRTARAWKQVEIYAFGPAEQLNLAANLGAEANPTLIEGAINSSTAIDAAFVAARPVAARGFWALEYLLFSRTTGSAAVLTALTTGPAAGRRRAYVAALAADARQRATAARDDWKAPTYTAAFVEADGNDVTSSISLLANASVQFVETIKNDRLGRPLGDANGGTAEPTTAEGYRSGTSGALVQASLDGLRTIWTGTPDARGLNGLLDHLGAQSTGGQALSTIIDGQIAAARNLAPADVVSQVDQSRQPVIDLQNAVKQLTVQLKTEAVSKLGVLLTFNDNDGD